MITAEEKALRAAFVAQLTCTLERIHDEYLWAEIQLPDGTKLGGHGYELPDQGYRSAKNNWALDGKSDLPYDYLTETIRKAGLQIPDEWFGARVGKDRTEAADCADYHLYGAMIEMCEDALDNKAGELEFFGDRDRF